MQDQAAKELLAQQAALGRTIRPGLSLHSYVSQVSGETIYQVCDADGVVFDTIYPSRLERFFE
ncbi:hypothetical protein ACI2VH_16530 [Ralstonia nicotianae]|uniref:Uncharacterized protein n=1 Tax=Ralstonia syzygii TaxID=28097 RepID=A0ABX7ZGK0_9RALS|nr:MULTISPECIES: hypothetical protein [Ralstonia solanacearum species complex]MBX9431960.1 hypothetical protein [Ralstonia pseudosolanacearum]MCK4165115.1 hypothetical protein [Ralstonia pseudosolanacearum]OIN68763.1 hypothetical protein BL248_23065 [Ralstonia solanacearum]QUP54466.1 hypothetical protein GO998_12285 [Ralstonia syzygii]